ncbi:MAG: ATP-binding cassette domain-containing protein [Fimbriimonadaceae bacterium]|nr:ATP-binding cassette domain-containing protein [Fimbriimonadaceae bacterium]
MSELRAHLRLRRGAWQLELEFALDGHTALVGPNGSGKTTVLDLLTGLAAPDQGAVWVAGDCVLDTARRLALPPARRRLGYVFQDAALFGHLSVAQNVGYGPAVGHGAAAQVDELLGQFELTELAARRPLELSAGERQRVAVARALAAEPRWLLLDEPFAALDVAARPLLRARLLATLEVRGVPALLVTHDAEEAFGLGGEVLVLEAGRLVEQGPAERLAASPSSAFGAALAQSNHYRGQVVASPAPGQAVVQVASLRWTVPTPAAVGVPLALVVPPAEVLLATAPPATSARNQVVGVVAAVQCTAAGCRVTVQGAVRITALVTPAALQELGLAVGSPAVALFKVSAVKIC